MASTRDRTGPQEAPLQRAVRLLYEGRSQRARWFRYGLLGLDVFTVAFFIAASMVHTAAWMRPVELALLAYVAVDFCIRLWISDNRRRYLLQIATIADVVVIVSLVVELAVENLAFLRILRALRLLRSYHVLGDLKRRFGFVRRHEQVILAAVNLIVFILVVTAAVYTFQHPVNPAIGNYIDALYFTVTTLTTVGYGDVTLTGASGRLLAILIMVLGVALFLRLAQSVFRASKVRVKCARCGLYEHDADASHCKHCGAVIHIPTAGD